MTPSHTGSAAHEPRIRHNYRAILLAAVACFCLEALWYTFFMDTWLEGIGRSRQDLMAAGIAPALQYLTALVAAVVMAVGLSCVLQLAGPRTALRGMRVAAMGWLGFVLPVWATEYVFEARPISLLAINAGFWLPGMLLMGAIVGAWKQKAGQ